MKKIFIAVFLGCLGLVSCKKFLALEPPASVLPQNAYSSAQQIQSAIAGLYNDLKHTNFYAQYYQYQTASTDETYFYNTSFPYGVYAASTADASAGNPANLWQMCYRSINYANVLLDNIDASSAGKVDTATVRRAKGEALFLRGFYYFMLVQWFGDVPLQLHATEGPENSQIARTPQKAVYDAVIDDMTKAEAMLYDQTRATLNYSERITQTGVQGILARVCLYAAGEPVNDSRRYEDALAWAKKVVASGKHNLLPSYPQVFIDESADRYNNETIWEMGFIQQASGLASVGSKIGIVNGVPMTTTTPNSTTWDSGYCYGYFRLQPRLFFKYEPGDYRREWNIGNYSLPGTLSQSATNLPTSLNISSYTQPGVAVKTPVANNRFWSRYPAKWRREYETPMVRATQVWNGTNFPVLRYSDVLLMLAEAEFKVNGATQTAFDALNQVRRRSISPTKIVDSISVTTTGTGYNYPPDSVGYTTGGGTGFGFNVVYTPSTKQVTVLLISNGAGFTSTPTIAIGKQWTPNAPIAKDAQIAAPNGRLYTITTAGITGATAPTHTSGAAANGTAQLTYAGFAAKATVYLSPTPVVDYSTTVLGQKGISFMQAIMDERARELCYEGLRRQDLKRWGILISTIQSLALDIYGTNADYPRIPSVVSELGTGTDAVPLAPTQSITAKDLYLPIPLYDLGINFKLTQNPGY